MWVQECQSVQFPVQVSGVTIQCQIHKKKLHEISGRACDTQAACMTAFQEFRFDIEDVIEQLIETEFDEQEMLIYA